MSGKTVQGKSAEQICRWNKFVFQRLLFLPTHVGYCYRPLIILCILFLKPSGQLPSGSIYIFFIKVKIAKIFRKKYLGHTTCRAFKVRPIVTCDLPQILCSVVLSLCYDVAVKVVYFSAPFRLFLLNIIFHIWKLFFICYFKCFWDNNCHYQLSKVVY